jgi:hypothetical protein
MLPYPTSIDQAGNACSIRETGILFFPMRTTPFRYSTLELLLLALVQRGFATTYDLVSKGGLSVGATSSALKRLQDAKFLISEPGIRGSKRFAIAPKGEAALWHGWELILREGPPVSAEDALRVLYLGWLFNQLRVGAKFAMWIAGELRVRGKQHVAATDGIRDRLVQLEPRPTAVEMSNLSIVTPYRFLRIYRDAEIAFVEADLIEKAVTEFEKFPPADVLRVSETQEPLF